MSRKRARRGNDGLTDAERHESAERWRNGAGRTPTKDEIDEIRRLTPVTHRSPTDLVVTDDYFDHLQRETECPARSDAATVDLLRSVNVEHR